MTIDDGVRFSYIQVGLRRVERLDDIPKTYAVTRVRLRMSIGQAVKRALDAHEQGKEIWIRCVTWRVGMWMKLGTSHNNEPRERSLLIRERRGSRSWGRIVELRTDLLEARFIIATPEDAKWIDAAKETRGQGGKVFRKGKRR